MQQRHEEYMMEQDRMLASRGYLQKGGPEDVALCFVADLDHHPHTGASCGAIAPVTIEAWDLVPV